METQQETRQEAVIQPIENIVQSGDEGMFTTSLIIAQAFEKEHKNVLRDIENLECSEEFRQLNFEHTPYTHPQNGQTYPAYRITRDGFCFLAMGFTGKNVETAASKLRPPNIGTHIFFTTHLADYALVVHDTAIPAFSFCAFYGPEKALVV